ncbi:MAG TPA: hypothetical protein VGW57_08825 [Chthoniobacterales bacterium]|nr:hypothetical protein [Chthoniobacterales bacterium]
MKRILIPLLGGSGLVLFYAGCATPTGDPNLDSIGFSPAKAERERLAPRRADLRREESSAEAERIRALTLKQQLNDDETRRQSNEDSIRRVRAQQVTSERELARLNEEVSASRARGETDDQLIRERDARQKEVDRLTAVLRELLRH